MALDATLVIAATSGELYVATVGTAFPLAPATTGFTGLGYVTEDGFSMTREFNVDDIRAFQSPYPVKRIPTEANFTISATFMQTDSTIEQLFYGVDATGDAPATPAAVERAVILDFTDGTVTKRLTIARAEVTADGDMTVSRGEAVGYPLTFTALAPASGPLYSVDTI